MPSRRNFLKTTAAAAALPALPTIAFARPGARRRRDTLRVGLVGCGGRGTGAAVQALRADGDAVLWAMGDVWAPKIEASLKGVTGEIEPAGPDGGATSRIDVAPARRFAGPDSYQEVIDGGCDVVLLCTPPAFRPAHLRAAIEAGKHVFCEKPVAVDSPGVRSTLESARMAKEKGLALRSGFCWRLNEPMREAFGKVEQGAIGDIRAVHTTYNTTGWVPPRLRDDGEATYHWMVRNWHYFYELSGDHIVEQAVHAIDWINWLLGPPAKCVATGGRQTRPDVPETGNVWDNFSATFEYASGARAFHTCRHWPNTPFDNSATVMGALGNLRMLPWEGRGIIGGENPWQSAGGGHRLGEAYQAEHDTLFGAIRRGEAGELNDGELQANSTLMAIMARQAAYTGQDVSWEQAMGLTDELNPQPWDLEQDRDIRPIPVPGQTKLV